MAWWRMDYPWMDLALPCGGRRWQQAKWCCAGSLPQQASQHRQAVAEIRSDQAGCRQASSPQASRCYYLRPDFALLALLYMAVRSLVNHYTRARWRLPRRSSVARDMCSVFGVRPSRDALQCLPRARNQRWHCLRQRVLLYIRIGTTEVDCVQNPRANPQPPVSTPIIYPSLAPSRARSRSHK